MKKFKLFLITLAILGCGVLFAQAKDDPQTVTPMPVPAIYFVKAKTLPQGKTAVRSYYMKPFITEMYNPVTQQVTKVPETMHINFNTFMIFGSYGITDRVTVGMNAKVNLNTIEGPDSIKKGYGVGDIETLLKISVLQANPVQLSFAVNTSFPTGSAVQSNTAIPLGTDSLDLSFRLLSDFRIGKTILSGSFFYTLKGRTIADSIDNGDSIRVIVTEAIPLPAGFSIELTANYEHGFADREDGEDLPRTKSDFLSFAFGAQYSITPSFTVQALYEFAPYVNDNFSRKHTLKGGLSINF